MEKEQQIKGRIYLYRKERAFRDFDHEIAPLLEYVSEENLDLEDKQREEATAKAWK